MCIRDSAAAAALVLYLSEGTAYHDDHIATVGELYTDQVRLFLEVGNYVLAKDYLHAQRYRTLLGHAMADVLAEVDILCTPTLPITAQPLGQDEPIEGCTPVEVAVVAHIDCFSVNVPRGDRV